MPEFVEKSPETIRIGRGSAAAALHDAYVKGIKDSRAGSIFLEEDENPRVAKSVLSRAAKTLQMRIRSSIIQFEGPAGPEIRIDWKAVGE